MQLPNTAESPSAATLPVLPGFSLLSSQGKPCDATSALTIYHAVALNGSQPVALKIIDPATLSQAGSSRQKLEQLFAVAQTFNHPNLARIFGSNARADSPYFIEEWLSEGSLDDYLRVGEPLYEVDVTALLGEVCDGLAYLHLRHVTHAAITPAHIRFDELGKPHLIHNGFARMVNAIDTRATGVVFGDARYASEAHFANQDLTPASDLYSLGIIAYQMATGRFPFEDAPAQKQLNQPIPDPRTFNPVLSHRFALALQKALHPDPTQRFVNARDFAHAFGYTENFHGMQDATYVFSMPAPKTSASSRPLMRRPAPIGPLKLLNSITGKFITIMPPRTIATRDLIEASDTMISRTNGAFIFDRNAWRLEELNDSKSANGIFINEQRLAEPRALYIGDQIRMGKTVLKVHG